MPTIRPVPSIAKMAKHTRLAREYVGLLHGIEDWILEGATHHHDPQKKTVYFKRGAFNARVGYSDWPPFVTISLMEILNAYALAQ